MQSITFKKYVLIGFVALIVNILIFIFWWVVTDPSNYIWKAIPSIRIQSIISACNKLFLIRYYVSVVSINIIGLAFVLFDVKRMLSLCIIGLGVLFYMLSSYFFSPFIGKNYFEIFLNQEVSKGLYLEPVQDAGKCIGPFLFDHLSSESSYTREQAARGLGVLSYTAAIDKLNQILNDSSESTNMRAECYFSLKKMNVKESKLLLEGFSIRQTTLIDSSLANKINYLEVHDPF